ncbi:MAG: hypothetical protein US60_C0028G0027 [Microgenomates group bacterium GW2011_GWC1_37_8]|uniref:CDP-alcohol phosphatidyltransferase n=1 Tax=Candidatus Woesebacteria bacterium GW2011_GWB1_38_8 TaxID=1618570 RepID=A0A0G0LA37_9BACT|nr:MAG: hypothetical protein US60_C0028G0027 [Microgenomates group bacterium GW2011_GWC1_37_8]KKQ84710.1 MAG: hypothetical protein UT08_C0014G0002 [Candidatus Woesebacteria bacterium GW2011_GWB1_38_8]
MTCNCFCFLSILNQVSIKHSFQNFNEKGYRVMVIIDVTLRVILGPLIFIAPIFSTLLVFILDWADGEFFKRAGFSKTRYDGIDKTLDLCWYLFIVLFIAVNPVPNKSLFYILFSYRAIGQFLYLFSKNEKFLFLFPNFFEILFYVYITALAAPNLTEFLYLPNIIFTLSLIIPIVLVREYTLHIKKSNLSWFFTGVTTYWKNSEGENN